VAVGVGFHLPAAGVEPRVPGISPAQQLHKQVVPVNRR
jgi:hypothetical protein